MNCTLKMLNSLLLSLKEAEGVKTQMELLTLFPCGNKLCTICTGSDALVGQIF